MSMSYNNCIEIIKLQDMYVINDPLGQTHSPVSRDHNSHLKVVLFCEILKSRDGRTDIQTTRAKIVITTGRDWVGLVDQELLSFYNFRCIVCQCIQNNIFLSSRLSLSICISAC